MDGNVTPDDTRRMGRTLVAVVAVVAVGLVLAAAALVVGLAQLVRGLR